MTTIKKLVPLSFSIPGFLSRYPSYIPGLNYSFPSFPVIGKPNITLQIIYEGLDDDTAELVFEQSLDNIHFDRVLDAAGNPITYNLVELTDSITINFKDINTAYLRFKLYLTTLTEGTFLYYIYLATSP
ncbi:MAG: hypothetical protein ACOYLE_09190 [Bacteroidales bacterium]